MTVPVRYGAMQPHRIRTLPPELFPMTAVFEDPDLPRGSKPLWAATIPGPGALVLPEADRERLAGRLFRQRTSYGCGSTDTIEPDGRRRWYRREAKPGPGGGVTASLIDMANANRVSRTVAGPDVDPAVWMALEDELPPNSFRCPVCVRTPAVRVSYHPDDVARGYCGTCRRVTTDEPAAFGGPGGVGPAQRRPPHG